MAKLKKQSQFPNGQNERKVNYNKEIRGIYRIGHLVKTNPIQSQTKSILVSPRIFWGLKGDLKKQSQFAPTLMDATPFVKGDYEEFHALRRRKNKAKQSQSKPILRSSNNHKEWKKEKNRSVNLMVGRKKWKTPKLAEIVPFLMLLIVFAADSRYNSQGEWACDSLAGLYSSFWPH